MSPPTMSSHRSRAFRVKRAAVLLGFNWYYAIFPQLEQNAIYNSVNFSISPMNACQYSAAIAKVSALLCPSESATLQLYPSTYLGVTGNYLAVSNYVGNYGGPAAIQPYSGTIVPGYNVEGATTTVGTMLPVIGMQAITDGTSNTGLVSERLLSLYPFGTTTLVYPQGPNGWRAVFTSTYGSAGPNTSSSPTIRHSCSPELQCHLEHDRVNRFGSHWSADVHRPSGVPDPVELRALDGSQLGSVCEHIGFVYCRIQSARCHRSLWLCLGEQPALRAAPMSASPTDRCTSSSRQSLCRPGGDSARAPGAR